MATFQRPCKQPDIMSMLNMQDLNTGCCNCSATGASLEISLAAADSCHRYAHHPEAEFAVTAFHCVFVLVLVLL